MQQTEQEYNQIGAERLQVIPTIGKLDLPSRKKSHIHEESPRGATIHSDNDIKIINEDVKTANDDLY
jgi:hypothetical protein